MRERREKRRAREKSIERVQRERIQGERECAGRREVESETRGSQTRGRVA